jgi:hypothetical protein
MVLMCILLHPLTCARITSLPILIVAYFMNMFGSQSEIAGM